MTALDRAFTPNETVPTPVSHAIILGWVVAWLGFWTLARSPIFPSPLDVVNALPTLWWRDGLAQAVMSSLQVNIEALILSALIALPVAYLSRVPIFTPVALGLSKLRFVSPSVFFLLLLFTLSGGHAVKVWMLVLGETFFLVTTMTNVVLGLPNELFDDARLLRMSEWRTTWYVVVRGTLPQALEAIRDNAAIGWSMLMMVEGIVRSEGGVGVLILNQEKAFNFAYVYAIAGVVVLVGLAQDWVLKGVREAVCPWVKS